jgi:hypothetical protein
LWDVLFTAVQIASQSAPGKQLNKHGYYQSKIVPGLWKHGWYPVQFALVVEDFGVKYVREEHALHLKVDLGENYTVTIK